MFPMAITEIYPYENIVKQKLMYCTNLAPTVVAQYKHSYCYPKCAQFVPNIFYYLPAFAGSVDSLPLLQHYTLKDV